MLSTPFEIASFSKPIFNRKKDTNSYHSPNAWYSPALSCGFTNIISFIASNCGRA
jgi:hypothetical protein